MPQSKGDILRALDLLNSYVRSKACRDDWTWTLGKAVYVYKTEFLRLYAAAWEAACYVIRSQVICRDCGGSGRYVDWYGYKHDHCWACNSSGRADLHFVETHWPAIAGNVQVPNQGPIWHTPLLKWPWIKVDGYSPTNDMPHKLPWATQYKPNQKGKDAPLRTVIEALDVVESWYWRSGETRPISNERGYSDWGDYPLRGFVTYKLNIGSRGSCPFCALEAKDDCYNCRAGGHPYLDWSEPVCRDCYEVNGDRIWDLLRQQVVPSGKCNADVMLFLRTHGEIVEDFGPKKEQNAATR